MFARRTDCQKYSYTHGTMSDLLASINDIFRTVFDDDDISVTRETTAADIADWDSLQHVTLVLHVEQRFGIRLKSSEVADLRNVGELMDIVQRRLQAN